MRYMLDTNILIYLMKNKPARVAERVSRLAPTDSLRMSFITWAELLKSVSGSSRPPEETRARLMGLARVVPVLNTVQPSIAEHYATQFLRLKLAGTPIGGNDLWIACHALSEDCTLVTNNLREFSRIDGLALENWAEEL
ncbi:VapC toxin protein [Vitreoscilla filiformis]|jgi:tRNA(fMet)-specific endonuclease VapC|uniref:Ribonuclease VapC n=1 Tax=Vitreoscilla filiformis TaxID=63 RepID=A0A221KHE5_VITFI|nr:type II toxin-antitoxin system VapC family toxin [Vitreoscilla filiformis]ASM78472.1 VapC toxin protein [Vitreoscilla filiformis]